MSRCERQPKHGDLRLESTSPGRRLHAHLLLRRDARCGKFEAGILVTEDGRDRLHVETCRAAKGGARPRRLLLFSLVISFCSVPGSGAECMRRNDCKGIPKFRCHGPSALRKIYLLSRSRPRLSRASADPIATRHKHDPRLDAPRPSPTPEGRTPRQDLCTFSRCSQKKAYFNSMSAWASRESTCHIVRIMINIRDTAYRLPKDVKENTSAARKEVDEALTSSAYIELREWAGSSAGNGKEGHCATLPEREACRHIALTTRPTRERPMYSAI